MRRTPITPIEEAVLEESLREHLRRTNILAFQDRQERVDPNRTNSAGVAEFLRLNTLWVGSRDGLRSAQAMYAATLSPAQLKSIAP